MLLIFFFMIENVSTIVRHIYTYISLEDRVNMHISI